MVATPAIRAGARAACIGLLPALIWTTAHAAPDAAGAVDQGCEQWVQAPWPTSPAARRALLDELQAQIPVCSGNTRFLVLVGALWLEEGDAARALLWLERALLLDPDAPGVRADHALALAAMGEFAARDELLREWRDRSDVPPALTRRLLAAGPAAPEGNGTRNGSAARWLQRREVSVVAGSETNLNRSPVLDGITLTSPDGPIELPLAVPIRPKAGQALQAELGWRVGYDNGAGMLWQASIALAARRAPKVTETDWHYVQGATEIWKGWGPWRTQLKLNLGAAAGPLNEPFNVYGLGAALERDLAGCTLRTSLDAEARRQGSSHLADGNIASALLSAQCRPVDGLNWRLGWALRYSHDRPTTAERPGASQNQWTSALQAAGTLGPVKLDLIWRTLRSSDTAGYSPLLENNAIRSYRQSQFQLELAYPLQNFGLQNAEAIVQWSTTRQRANIVVFEHQGDSSYGGLRWRW